MEIIQRITESENNVILFPFLLFKKQPDKDESFVDNTDNTTNAMPFFSSKSYQKIPRTIRTK